jgi:hypothetical protein
VEGYWEGLELGYNLYRVCIWDAFLKILGSRTRYTKGVNKPLGRVWSVSKDLVILPAFVVSFYLYDCFRN